MNFGAHVSISPGIELAPQNAQKLGCECFQIFSQSPRGGTRRLPTEEKIQQFKTNLKKYNQKTCYVHTPYFINLASKNNRIFYGSINAIKKDLEIAQLLQAKAVVTHLGSYKDFVNEKNKTLKNKTPLPEKAKALVLKGLNKILDSYSDQPMLLLEIAAGSGHIIGSSIQELAFFIQEIAHPKLGFCFDTAHAFASGLDLREKKQIQTAIQKIKNQINLDKMPLIHLNDSKSKFNSKVDRHTHLGEGEIGLSAIQELLRHKRLQNIDYILETPSEQGVKKDLAWLKQERAKI
ncbi:MAG: deoxyribonuclease IV [Candidatus Moranbacteria bacterium]|nr:deoxyribonuclease IV [Candidatus Moranbacteria bacterium]